MFWLWVRYLNLIMTKHQINPNRGIFLKKKQKTPGLTSSKWKCHEIQKKPEKLFWIKEVWEMWKLNAWSWVDSKTGKYRWKNVIETTDSGTWTMNYIRDQKNLLSCSSVQLLSRVWLFATTWIAAHQASLSVTNSWSSLRLTSIESVIPSSHLSHPLSSPSPPAPNPSQHQSLIQWVSSSHEVAKVLEFQL